jgi:flagellar assembly protein FliH
MHLSSNHPIHPEEKADAQVFSYPSAPAENPKEQGEDANRKRIWSASVWTKAGLDPASASQKEQQILQRGIEEGKAAARAGFEQAAARLHEEIGRALRDFEAERDSYFQRVEEQVVRLALAIVRKILHRESQVDPLLLTGIMRVALEQIDAGSKIKLRANPVDIEVWRGYFTQAGENIPKPELTADPNLERYRCILETELGTTEIGLETQLKEIEQGFLDLLAQRPGSR